MKRHRSFIALPVTSDTMVPLALLQQQLADRLEGFRPTPGNNLHLTLIFLGDRSVQELEKIADIMLSVGPDIPAFELFLTTLLLLGRNTRKRPLCLDVGTAPTLQDLHKVLYEKITSAGIELERRKFRPHLTLGRIRPPWPAPGELNLIDRQEITLEVNKICLFSSQLLAQGARHELLNEIKLKIN